MPRDSNLVEKPVCIYLTDLLEGLQIYQIFIFSLQPHQVNYIESCTIEAPSPHGVPWGHYWQLTLSFRFSCHSLGYLALWFLYRWTKGILRRKFVVDMCHEISGNSIVILGWSYNIRLVVMDTLMGWIWETTRRKVGDWSRSPFSHLWGARVVRVVHHGSGNSGGIFCLKQLAIGKMEGRCINK